MEVKQEKVLVSLSGGMDSTTVLYYAVASHGAKFVEAISFDYGSKHNDKELEFAAHHCAELGVKHTIMDLKQAFSGFKSNLLKDGDDIPQGLYDQSNMSLTVVPNRNMIFMSLMGGLADSIGASKILLGSHAGDHAVYADCRVEFTKAVSLALYIATEGRVEVESPFNKLSKSDIGNIGLETLNIDYSKTYSCYEGGDRHCYKCGTCSERVEVFLDNNTKDPSATLHEWADAVDTYNKYKKGSKNG